MLITTFSFEAYVHASISPCVQGPIFDVVVSRSPWFQVLSGGREWHGRDAVWPHGVHESRLLHPATRATGQAEGACGATQ